MKLLTVNFLTCAIRSCKTSPLSFPLHFRDAELEQQEIEYNPIFLQNILPRLDWDAVKTTAAEVCINPSAPFPKSRDLVSNLLSHPLSKKQLSFTTLPANKPSPSAVMTTEAEEQGMRDLHTLLLETEVREGKMVCGNCGHEYPIKEGIANFLLPNHLGESLLSVYFGKGNGGEGRKREEGQP